jgi:Predicted sugar kinase
MATGGTGDVLTGILTALIAQGYDPREAAVAGTHIHGLAGDMAASMISPEAMVASDIVDYLGAAFSQLVH